MAEPDYPLPRPILDEHFFLYAIAKRSRDIEVELQHIHNVLDEIKAALQHPSPHPSPHADSVELREPEKPKPKRG